MAKVVVKGTVLNHFTGTTGTAISQVISYSHGGAESETYDATTLDTTGAGKEYSQTGYSEGGTFDFQLFFDPGLAIHQSITDDVTTPAEREYSIVFADAATTTQTFDAAGTGIGFTGEMSNGLTMDVSLKLDQLMAYAS
jgi:hypothetical protein